MIFHNQSYDTYKSLEAQKCKKILRDPGIEPGTLLFIYLSHQLGEESFTTKLIALLLLPVCQDDRIGYPSKIATASFPLV